jgi:hypothetical protein
MSDLDKPDHRPLRIGNCSGFYGDRLSAMREMLEGGELDFITGDYLAELTMLILGKDQMRDPSLGYARTFARQVEDCLGLALDRGVRVVANAGGLNPSGLAAKLTEIATGLGLSPSIAYVEGDNLTPRAQELGFGNALTANAYLGGFGIAQALTAGADIVVTGRVTDASVVVGPAIAHFGWTATSYDELAGAVVAGHIIECGTQATGGNFSGFLELPRDARPLGFPLAEISADGSFVVTKHAGTGGAVTVDTVTAQLVYEIQTAKYLGPDVTTDLTSITLEQVGPDRVAVSGVTGEAPPEQLKVCVNELGGWRNQFEFVLTGLDIEAKAGWVRTQLEAAFGATPPASVTWSQSRIPGVDADSEEAASCLLRCTVMDPSADKVGKAFTAPAVELALGSYPGFTMTAPPGPASPYGIYRPAYVDRSAIEHTIVLADGSRFEVPDASPEGRSEGAAPAVDGTGLRGVSPSPSERGTSEPGQGERNGWLAGAAPSRSPSGEALTETTRLPFGTFIHARSGDKGGDANLGLWVKHDSSSTYDARVAWLLDFATVENLTALLPEAADLEMEIYRLPNLGGVNVLIRGLLGEGVAASTRFDPQAKGLGEWARSRYVEIPEELL